MRARSIPGIFIVVAATRVQSIEAIPIRLPRDLQGATGTAGSPNQLSGTGNYCWSRDYPALYSTYLETAMVKVTLSNGLTGWGEAQAPLAPEVACTIIDLLLAPVLVGTEFDGSRAAIEAAWQRMYSTMRVRGQTGGFMLDAISGVDLALWDLAGKIMGQSVSDMIGGGDARRRINAYVSGLPGGSVEARVQAAQAHFEEGFRVFKLYYESDWHNLLETIDSLRAALGGDIKIAIDALWHLDRDHAIEMAQELDRRQVLWLECPLLPEEVAAHGVLARNIRTPIAIGESYRTRFEISPFLDAGIAGYIQPDLGRSGITESLRIAVSASSRGARIVPHVSIALGPQIAAALHFAAVAPGCDLCEYNPRVLEAANRFLLGPLQVIDAQWIVPTGTGLGIEIEEQALRNSIMRCA
jgi:galactonate dehydratase